VNFLSLSIGSNGTAEIVIEISIYHYRSLPNYDDFCFWETLKYGKGPLGS